MSGLHSLDDLILKSWRLKGWGGGLLTLTLNNLIYLEEGALIGLAHSFVNQKKIYGDFTLQKLMLSTVLKIILVYI